MARYTNRGVKDNFLTKGSIDTDKTHSDTATAVRWGGSDGYVDFTTLGFSSYPSEIWIRFDIWYVSPYSGSIYWQFDNVTDKSNGINLAGSCWVNNKNYNKYQPPSVPDNWGCKRSEVNKVVVHISGTLFEVYTNDVLQFLVDDFGTAGNKITSISLDTSNSAYSNIIIADYDCSDESLVTKVIFDTKRSLANGITANFDTLRKILSALVKADVYADTKRTLKSSVPAGFDTRREVESNLIHILVGFDTKRVRTSDCEVEFDTKRVIVNIVSFEADTSRNVKEIVYSVELEADTLRRLFFKVEISSDTRRRLGLTTELNADTQRVISAIVEISGDTKRDLLLNLGKLKNSGVQNISLTLQTGTLADSFSLTGVNKIYPKDAVEGVLLDFPFHFRAEETSERGILFSVNRGTYNAAQMLYAAIKYEFNYKDTKHDYKNRSEVYIKGYSAMQHMEKLADKLGFNYHYKAIDFVPQSDYSNSCTTAQSVMSSLFSWTGEIPRKKIFVFVRNKTELYIFQRGNETGNINLDEYKWFNTPSYNRKVLRTLWLNPEVTDYASGAVRSGFLYGPPSKTLDELMGRNGYSGVGEESYTRSDGKTDNRIRYTEKTNPDGSKTTTNYEYIDTGKNYYLREINEVTIKEPQGDVPGYRNTRRTVYTYLFGGWRHIDVYENDVKIEESEDASGIREEDNNTGSNVDRMRPGDEGNEFLDEQSSLSYGGNWDVKTSNGNSYLTDRDAPVLDYDSAEMYFGEIEWMNGAIEETVTLTITAPVKNGDVAPEDNHVFDFFDTYTLNGNTYYLESNTVSLTPRSLKQELTLIRWYK